MQHRICAQRGFVLIAILLTSMLAACQINPPSPPPIIGQDCGTMSIFTGGPEITEGIQGTTQGDVCLWHAYQQCHAATLVLMTGEIDIRTEYAITVQPKRGRCQVTDADQGYFASGGGSKSPVTTYTCGGLVSQYGGLMAYACGSDGNLSIPHVDVTITDPHVPANLPTTTPTICGTVKQYAAPLVIAYTNGSVPTPNYADPPGCLSQDWFFQCVATQLTYDFYNSTGVVQHLFTLAVTSTNPCRRTLTDTVQSVGLIAPASDIHSYACAGATNGAQGVVVYGCGAEGAVLIPNKKLPPPTVANAILDPAVPPRIGMPCQNGDNYTGNSGGYVNYRDCFWQAYQHCQPAWIPLYFFGNPTVISHTLAVQPHNGACLLTDDVQYQATYQDAPFGPYQTFTCGVLRQQDNELVATGCGALGDIAMP